jgi:hypothetical protein
MPPGREPSGDGFSEHALGPVHEHPQVVRIDAGLQIMISDVPRTGFDSLLQGLADSGHLRVYAWIVGIVLVATLLLTLFDRRMDPNFPKRTLARWGSQELLQGHVGRGVGEIFEPDKHGLGLPQNSPLRRFMSIDLIGAEEAGVIEALRTQYFGARQ